jgi:hypothetical protein
MKGTQSIKENLNKFNRGDNEDNKVAIIRSGTSIHQIIIKINFQIKTGF